MHLQPAAKSFGYKKGDFLNAENISKSILSLPVHEFITKKQMDFTISEINRFYK